MFDATLMKSASAAIASTSNDGGDEAPAHIGSPMRGWQWKMLQGQQQQALQSWMPRLVRSEATPLTQLLASPGKQGLIGAGVGGLLGGGAGVAAGQLLPDVSPELQAALAGGGLGLGALFGASRAYGSRRRENDRIIDALRRTPPGATIRDYEALQKADAAQAL